MKSVSSLKPQDSEMQISSLLQNRYTPTQIQQNKELINFC